MQSEVHREGCKGEMQSEPGGRLRRGEMQRRGMKQRQWQREREERLLGFVE